MAEVNDVYKCNVCGQIIEVIHAGAGDLVCCGEKMQHMTENTEDAAKEKHVPVKEKSENGVTVKVGSVPHPMEKDHYIEWVQVIHEGWSCRRFLKPGESPEAVFCNIPEEAIAREYCNKHGLWKS